MDPAKHSRRTSAGIVFLTLFLDLVGFSIIFPLFPAMLDHYLAAEGPESAIGHLVSLLESWTPRGGDSERHLLVETLFGGVLGSVYSLLQFLFSPFWGRMSDRHGRRPILVVTVAGIALSYVLWAVSGSFLLLVAARVIGGIMSGNISTATAAMADITSEADRAKGMGVIGAAFGLGFILGPAIGAGLSAVDLAELLPGATAYGINPFSMPALGALALSLANLALIARGFRETLPAEGRDAARRRTASLRAFLDPDLSGPVHRTNASYFIFITAFSGMEFTLTFLARDRFAWQPPQMAGMFVFVGVIIAVVQGGVVRRLAPRFGEKRVAIGGLLLVVPGLLILAGAKGEEMFYGGLASMAVGSALAIPTQTALVSLLSPTDQQGYALGVFRSLGALARAVGPFAAALIYWRWGSGSPYAWGAVALAAPVLLLSTVPAPRPAAASTARSPTDARTDGGES